MNNYYRYVPIPALSANYARAFFPFKFFQTIGMSIAGYRLYCSVDSTSDVQGIVLSPDIRVSLINCRNSETSCPVHIMNTNKERTQLLENMITRLVIRQLSPRESFSEYQFRFCMPY